MNLPGLTVNSRAHGSCTPLSRVPRIPHPTGQGGFILCRPGMVCGAGSPRARPNTWCPTSWSCFFETQRTPCGLWTLHLARAPGLSGRVWPVPTAPCELCWCPSPSGPWRPLDLCPGVLRTAAVSPICPSWTRALSAWRGSCTASHSIYI